MRPICEVDREPLMPTPDQQIENLEAALSELNARIETREGELVAAQTGVLDGEVNDLELIGLYELRRKFLKELEKHELK